MVNYSYANYLRSGETRTPSRQAVWKIILRDDPAKRRFRSVKTVEEKRKMLEQSVPKYTRSATKCLIIGARFPRSRLTTKSFVKISM